jgi:TetR/AcrR family hemagglutinin/protease transcriptional regulator
MSLAMNDPRPMAAPQRRRRRLDPATRRAHLLVCAMNVFARRGIGRGTHAEVAKEAGVSVPTVFSYFPTRSALVDAVLEEVERFLLAMGERTCAAAPDARAALLELADGFTNALRDEPDTIRVWLDWSTAVREDVWPAYLRFIERMLGMVSDTIARDIVAGRVAPEVDPADAALIFVGEAHMVALMHFSGVAPERIRRFLARAVAGALGLPAGA